MKSQIHHEDTEYGKRMPDAGSVGETSSSRLSVVGCRLFYHGDAENTEISMFFSLVILCGLCELCVEKTTYSIVSYPASGLQHPFSMFLISSEAKIPVFIIIMWMKSYHEK